MEYKQVKRSKSEVRIWDVWRVYSYHCQIPVFGFKIRKCHGIGYIMNSKLDIHTLIMFIMKTDDYKNDEYVFWFPDIWFQFSNNLKLKTEKRNRIVVYIKHKIVYNLIKQKHAVVCMAHSPCGIECFSYAPYIKVNATTGNPNRLPRTAPYNFTHTQQCFQK